MIIALRPARVNRTLVEQTGDLTRLGWPPSGWARAGGLLAQAEPVCEERIKLELRGRCDQVQHTSEVRCTSPGGRLSRRPFAVGQKVRFPLLKDIPIAL
jgi:hypothetical protein